MIKTIELNKIKILKNIRLDVDEDLSRLAKDIEEKGLLNPLTVRQNENGKYELIAGHRRYKALTIAGFKEAECNVIDSDLDATLVMVAENVQRKQMSAWELYDITEKLKQERHLTNKAIGDLLHMNERQIANIRNSVSLAEKTFTDEEIKGMQEKKTTANQIVAKVKKIKNGQELFLTGNGLTIKSAGHTYRVTCGNNKAENDFLEFVKKYIGGKK